MVIFALLACGTDGIESDGNDDNERGERDGDALAWHVEILGECPSTEEFTWTPPESTATVSIRTDRTDGMTVWTAGSQVSTDADGLMVIPCAVGSDLVLTYAVAEDAL